MNHIDNDTMERWWKKEKKNWKRVEKMNYDLIHWFLTVIIKKNEGFYENKNSQFVLNILKRKELKQCWKSYIIGGSEMVRA